MVNRKNLFVDNWKAVSLTLLFLLVFPWSGKTEAAEVYQVQSGDTLWALSRKWEVSMEEVRGLNSLATDNLLVGQVLLIPSKSVEQFFPPVSLNNDTNFLYLVQERDTLVSLAKQWGVSVAEIRTANKNIGQRLIPEQILVIPPKALTKIQNYHRQNIEERKENPPARENLVYRGGQRNVAGIAQGFIGVPYIAGSTNPGIGFDCSGFTQYVHSLIGIKLPRTSSSQYNLGLPIERSQLDPGDLVFFSTNGITVNHVGIYLGADNFISATLSRGVAIDNLNSSYWGPRYLGARRLI